MLASVASEMKAPVLRDPRGRRWARWCRSGKRRGGSVIGVAIGTVVVGGGAWLVMRKYHDPAWVFAVAGTLTVTLLPGSIYVLNASAQGALTLSGDSSINISGNLVVDSSASGAITASGDATVTAAAVQVV